MKPFLEKIPSTDHQALYVQRLNIESFNYPLHFHPEYELTYIITGSGKRFVGDDISPFHEGDLVLIGPNLPHCWLDYGQNEQNVEAIVVQFGEGALGTGIFEIPEMRLVKQMLNKAEKGMAFDAVSERIYEKVTNIPEAQGPSRMVQFLSVLADLSMSSNYRTLNKIAFRLNGDHSKFDRINVVINYLYQNYSKRIKLADVARMVNMNVSAFCHYFKKCTNKTFSQYLNEIRIGYACKILVETESSISNICFQSGYNNLSLFNKKFKELNGMTPRRYRTEFSSY